MKLYTYDKLKKIKQIKKSGFVYCIDYHNGNVKIGSTNNPKQRYKTLSNNAANYGNYPLGKIWLSPRCSNYSIIEKRLHKIFSKQRIPNTELFNIDFNDFDNIINSLNIQYDRNFGKSYALKDTTDSALGTSLCIGLLQYPNNPAKAKCKIEELYNLFRNQ